MKSKMNGCRMLWNTLNVESIESRTQAAQAKVKSFYDKIVSQENVDKKNFAKTYALLQSDFDVEYNQLTFLQYVSPDKAIRDAASAADKSLDNFSIEQSMREDLFKAFEKASSAGGLIDAELNRLIERRIKSGKRDGLHLTKEIRDKIEAIDKEMSVLGIDYNKSLNEECTLLEFTAEELAGVPKDNLEGFKKNDAGKYLVSLKYPDYFPCMEYCQVPETRQKLELNFSSRCIKENIPRLERLIELRNERAQILGYKTHADFVLEMRMAKEAGAVKEFLEKLGKGLKPIREKQLARLVELKKQECEEKKLPFDNKINYYDFRYYSRKSIEIDYKVDKDAMKKYFPLIQVKSGIMKLYQNLLGLKFTKVDTDNIWHPEVDTYEVIDVKDKDRLLGYFYMDLHPRDGKYGHAAAFQLQCGAQTMDTPDLLDACDKEIAEIVSLAETPKRQIAVAALVANFTKPKPDAPEESTLTHDEVETFFHEFGHIMHQICGHTGYSTFSGSSVERDFVECPSQMLENWVWCEEGLNGLLVDAKPIPRELIEKLAKSKYANAGLTYSRQVVLATFDQILHTLPGQKLDIEQVLAKLYDEHMGMSKTSGTNMAASFGHLAGGYDAQYYGYLWSEVFATDMFTSKFQNAPDGGVLSPTVGYEYRTKILHPGGSVDASVMLKNFLGRDPDHKPFFRNLGLDI